MRSATLKRGLVLWLAATMAQAPMVRAGEAPAALPSARLKWHVKGIPAPASASADEAPQSAPRELPTAPRELRSVPGEFPTTGAKAPAPLRELKTGQPTKRLSSRLTRSNFRTPVTQASNQDSQPASDPFETSVEPSRSEPNLESSLPSSEPAADEPAPLRSERSDPFPDERIPLPPSRESDMPEPRQVPLPESQEYPAEGMSCASARADCEDLIKTLQKRDITTIYVGLVIEEDGQPAVEGRDYPCECRIPKSEYIPRNWSQTVMTWKASGLCHKPLYFEDVQLERYGHSWNPVVQPFASAAHFFVSVPLLPYKMGLTPPNECMYTLGYYRPGNCAPWMIDPIPLSARAAVYQALGVTGFIFYFWPPVTNHL